MDRVAEIRRIEELASKVSSEDRWQEAEHVWHVVDDGMSRQALAAEVGCSGTHIGYLYKCWEYVSKLGLDLLSLPQFNEVYHSAEVRGNSVAKTTSSNTRERTGQGGAGATNPRDKDADDSASRPETASDWVACAAGDVARLTELPGWWPMLTGRDRDQLRDMIPKIRTILKEKK